MQNEKGHPSWMALFILLARPERFELPTSWFVAMRSIQLSYGRVYLNDNERTKSLSQKLTRKRTGGERGIRTLDGLLTHTPLAGVRLRPLGHLSGAQSAYQSHLAGSERGIIPRIAYAMTSPPCCTTSGVRPSDAMLC
jgi:hypothetical protein